MRKRTNPSTLLLASLSLANVWGFAGSSSWSSPPLATQSDARLFLKRSADGACLVRGANLTYGDCEAGATWLLHGHPEKGWALRGAETTNDPDASTRNRHSLRNEPQCLSGHWRQLKMGPCDAKHRWLLRPSADTAGEWHLVWKVLFSNFGQKALCVGVAPGPGGVRGWRSSGDETPHGAERLGLTEGNCTAFKVHEPGKLSAGAAEGASWWLAGILASTPTAVPGGSAPGGASAAASGRDGSSSEEGSASAAERPWWQHTKKAEQTVVAQLRRKGSRALQAFGFQRGRSSSSSSSSYFSGYARGPAVTSGRGRAGGGAVSGGGRRAAPRGSPGLSTRAHTSLAAASTSTSAASTSGSSSDYSSSEASVAAALAGRSSSNGRSGHLRSGAAQTLLREPRVYTSSSSRGGGEVWTDSRTGLTLPLALGPSFDSSEIDSGSSSRDGSGNGEGQVLLGGGAFSKWGMPVYVVGLYAEAASPALAASLVYARATSGTVNSAASEATTGHLSHGAAADTNRSGEGSEGSSRRKRESAEAAYNSDSNCSGHTAVPSPQEPSPSMGEGPHPPPHHGPGQAGRASWLASLDADTLRNDPAFYLALTAPAAYDRTLLLKLAMSVNPRHLQSAMMASWLMPPHHKRRILAATTLGFGGGVDDGSADSSDSTTSSTGSSSGSSDATACCERGTEIAFTWRGRTGALELRVNGQLLYTMREEVALKEASAMLRSSGGSSSWSSSTSSRTHPNGGSLAVDFFGSSSDSSSSASSSKVPHSAAAMAFAAPASNFDDLKVEMDTALKVTGAATSMTSLGHGSSTSRSSGSERGSSSFAHAPFGTSLPRALMYQYLAADELVLISPTARDGFANRAAVALGGAAAMAPFVQSALAQDARMLAALELQAPRSTATSTKAAAQVAVAGSAATSHATATPSPSVIKGHRQSNRAAAPSTTPTTPRQWLSAVSSFDEAYELPPTAASAKLAQQQKKRKTRAASKEDGDDDEEKDEPTSLAGRLLARAKTAWAMRARRRMGIMGSKGGSSIDGTSNEKLSSHKRRHRNGGSQSSRSGSSSSSSSSSTVDDSEEWWDVFCRWWAMSARVSIVVALLSLAARALGRPSPVLVAGAWTVSLLALVEQRIRSLMYGSADASSLGGSHLLRRKSSASFDGLFYNSKCSPRHRGRSRGSVRAAAMAAAQRNTLSPPPLALSKSAVAPTASRRTPKANKPAEGVNSALKSDSNTSSKDDQSRWTWRSWYEWAQEQLLLVPQLVWPISSNGSSIGLYNNNSWPAAAVPAAKRLQQWWRRVRPPFLLTGRVKRQTARLERRASSQTPTQRRSPSSSRTMRLQSPTSPPSTPPQLLLSSSSKHGPRSASSGGKRSAFGVNSSQCSQEGPSGKRNNHRPEHPPTTTNASKKTERGRGPAPHLTSTSSAAAATAPRSRSSSAVRALAARFSGGGKGNGRDAGEESRRGNRISGSGMVMSSPASNLRFVGAESRTSSSSSSSSLSPRSLASPFLPPPKGGATAHSSRSSSGIDGSTKPLGPTKPFIRPRPRSVEPAGPPPPPVAKLPTHITEGSSSSSRSSTSTSSADEMKNASRSPGMYGIRKTTTATTTAATSMTAQRTARASTSDVGSSSLSSYAAFVGAFASRSSAGRASGSGKESDPSTLTKVQQLRTCSVVANASSPLFKQSPKTLPSSSISPGKSVASASGKKSSDGRISPAPTRGRSRVRGAPPPSPPLPTDTYSREGRSRCRNSSSRPHHSQPLEMGACGDSGAGASPPSPPRARGTSAKRAATPP